MAIKGDRMDHQHVVCLTSLLFPSFTHFNVDSLSSLVDLVIIVASDFFLDFIVIVNY